MKIPTVPHYSVHRSPLHNAFSVLGAGKTLEVKESSTWSYMRLMLIELENGGKLYAEINVAAAKQLIIDLQAMVDKLEKEV